MAAPPRPPPPPPCTTVAVAVPLTWHFLALRFLLQRVRLLSFIVQQLLQEIPHPGTSLHSTFPVFSPSNFSLACRRLRWACSLPRAAWGALGSQAPPEAQYKRSGGSCLADMVTPLSYVSNGERAMVPA